jgi:hypothetical protein
VKLSNDMLFAHPVLSPTSTDFEDALFDADFAVTIGDGDNLDISASLALKCDDLAELLNSGGAGSGFYLICRQTYENRLVEMALGSKQYRFKASDFFGTIHLRPVVWSKQERKQWRSQFLHAEYGGVADFPAAAVLAIGDDQTFSVDRERLKPFESIFSLAAQADLVPGQIAVDTDAEKIIIKVHPQTKESIEGIRNNTIGRNVLLNAVYLPAVMHLLNEVAADPGRCESLPWFRIFQAKCAGAGIDHAHPDVLRDAQRLLGLPFLKIEAAKERLFG